MANHLCTSANYVSKSSKREASENDQYPDYLYNQTPHRVRYASVIRTVKFVKTIDVPRLQRKRRWLLKAKDVQHNFMACLSRRELSIVREIGCHGHYSGLSQYHQTLTFFGYSADRRAVITQMHMAKSELSKRKGLLASL